ncbi:hypothetical protein [Streptosporangium roseum]|uniref:hypothetical protein n=1 Tax=Streptosporangium roseum TaxID=2001 RepID=UPI0009D65132|nr:hypothetical protein [Streptosporangium roseum]
MPASTSRTGSQPPHRQRQRAQGGHPGQRAPRAGLLRHLPADPLGHPVARHAGGDVAQPAGHGGDRLGGALVGQEERPLPPGHGRERQQEQAQADDERRQHQHEHLRDQRHQAEHHAHHGEGEGPDDRDDRGEGVTGQLDLQVRPGHRRRVRPPPGHGRPVQRALDDVAEQVLPERLHDGGDGQHDLPRAGRGDQPGAGEHGQPGEAGARPAGGEAIVDRPRDGEADDESGRGLRDGPESEAEQLVRIPPQRPADRAVHGARRGAGAVAVPHRALGGRGGPGPPAAHGASTWKTAR